jgi:hypothetical protein
MRHPFNSTPIPEFLCQGQTRADHKEVLSKQYLTSIRNVSRLLDLLDLVNAFQLGREPSMHAQNSVVNESCNWQAVEAVYKELPKLDVVPSFA